MEVTKYVHVMRLIKHGNACPELHQDMQVRKRLAANTLTRPSWNVMGDPVHS
jgi:hypothetical protein